MLEHFAGLALVGRGDEGAGPPEWASTHPDPGNRAARILERARTLLPEQTFRIWLAHTEPLALSQDVLTVAAGSEFAAEWIEDKYGDLLGEVAERVVGQRLRVQFDHRSRGGAAISEPAAQQTQAPAPKAQAPQVTGTPIPLSTDGAPLNERYVFDRFVVGANNQPLRHVLHRLVVGPVVEEPLAGQALPEDHAEREETGDGKGKIDCSAHGAGLRRDVLCRAWFAGTSRLSGRRL